MAHVVGIFRYHEDQGVAFMPALMLHYWASSIFLCIKIALLLIIRKINRIELMTIRMIIGMNNTCFRAFTNQFVLLSVQLVMAVFFYFTDIVLWNGKYSIIILGLWYRCPIRCVYLPMLKQAVVTNSLNARLRISIFFSRQHRNIFLLWLSYLYLGRNSF